MSEQEKKSFIDDDTLREIYKNESDETFRSLITYSQMGIRSSLIMNGGAALALLAFCGNIIAKTGVQSELVNSLVQSLWWFLGGVLLSTLTAFFAYTTQFSLLQFYYKDQGRAYNKTIERKSDIFLLTALICNVCSILCFTIGSVIAGISFTFPVMTH